MRGVADRVSEWVDIAADLLQRPLGSFPVAPIVSELRRTFDSPSVSFNWRTETGPPGLVVPEAEGGMVAGRPLDEVVRMARTALESGVLDEHPLLRWFAATGRPDAWSMGRVPRDIAGPRARELYELFEAFELRQQLSVPVVMGGRRHEAFVVTRPGRQDFTDEDLLVARRVQPLLRGLRVQAGTVAELVPTQRRNDLATVLTAREVAVLALLIRGCTATAIGHRLGMSPRTASKHIEHIYRKLQVRDRVSAAITAQRLGLDLPAADGRPGAGRGVRPLNGHAGRD